MVLAKFLKALCKLTPKIGSLKINKNLKSKPTTKNLDLHKSFMQIPQTLIDRGNISTESRELSMSLKQYR